MKLVIGGTISIILGIVGITVFFSNLADIIQGLIPLILIAGGVFVVMLKREEAGFGKQEDDAPVVPEPTTNEPACSAPVVPEPVAKEPAVEEPVVEESVAEKTVETKTPDDEPEAPAQESSAFVGNESSLVFHSSDCKFSTSKKCTFSFATREDAIEKGFKPCTICKP